MNTQTEPQLNICCHNPEQDYSWMYGYDLVTEEQEQQIHQQVKKFNDPFQPELPEHDPAFPLKLEDDFNNEQQVKSYLQQIQYFYKLVHNDFEDPDFGYTSQWMQIHHMHPQKLKGKNGMGQDINQNKVRVPLPVHWYLHYLHGVIADFTQDDVLVVHSKNSCQMTLLKFPDTTNPEEDINKFFQGHDINKIREQVENSRCLWTPERILESAKKYNTKSEWQKENKGAYKAANKLKKTNPDIYVKATEHMKDGVQVYWDNNRKWTPEAILESAKKYNTKIDWANAESSAYQIAKRSSNKQLFQEATAHMHEQIKPVGYWNKERLEEHAKKYQKKKQWEKAEPVAYNAAIRIRKQDQEWYDRITSHMVTTRNNWDIKSILESAKKYNTKSKWQKENKRAYNAASRDKQLFQEATAHMFYLPISNGNITPNIINLYEYLLENPDLIEHEYITNDKYQHRLKQSNKNKRTELKNFFNKYKAEFEAWIQEQQDKGIRELDPYKNKYVYTKAFESGELFM